MGRRETTGDATEALMVPRALVVPALVALVIVAVSVGLTVVLIDPFKPVSRPSGPRAR